MMLSSLLCKNCNKPLEKNEFGIKCPECSFQGDTRQGIIMYPVDCGLESENPCKNLGIHERVNVPFTTSWCEKTYWETAITEALSFLPELSNRIGLDIGCGDGHYTELMMRNGVQKMVAVDLDLNNLQKFRGRTETTPVTPDGDILYIRCNMLDMSFKKETFDFVAALGAISSVGDKTCVMYERIYHWLKPDGVFLVCEPSVDSALLYALVVGDLEEAAAILETKTKRVPPTNNRFPVTHFSSIEKTCKETNFHIVRESFSPALFSLTFGSGKWGVDAKTQKLKENIYNLLLENLPYLADVPRMNFVIMKKG